MPVGNNFQHSNYTRTDPGDRVGYREVEPAAPPDSVPWQDAMAGHGARLVETGVRAVVFMHGTYLGTDLFGIQRLDEAGGLRRGYSRGISGLDALLAMMRGEEIGTGTPSGAWTPPFLNDEPTLKSLDDKVGEAANFTSTTVSLFEKAVNREAAGALTCVRYLWSCEHHHLGRAKAAIQFIARLRGMVSDRSLGRDDRILIQAHGHAGQVVALASNLLAPATSSARKVIVEILKASLDQTEGDQLIRRNLMTMEPLFGTGDVLNGVSLDVVTFGTPIRYGWDPSALGKLLHIVNHRMMRQDGKRWLAKMEMPQVTMEMPIAWGGDYVQQLGVAGCDASPTNPEAREANKALWEILEPWDGFERWLECARRCVRCANDGTCLLVDYKDSTGSTNPLDHLYGHATYTRMDHLLFNTKQIVETLYATS